MNVGSIAPEGPTREFLSPVRLWTGAVIIAVLAGVTAGTLGPEGVAAVAVVAAAGLAVVRWPGFVFAAYLLLPYYKGFVNPYVPLDLTVALAVMNGVQVLWILRGGWRQLRRESLILWLALTLVVVAGMARAPDLDESVPRVVQWVALIVLPSCAAVRIASNPRARSTHRRRDRRAGHSGRGPRRPPDRRNRPTRRPRAEHDPGGDRRSLCADDRDRIRRHAETTGCVGACGARPSVAHRCGGVWIARTASGGVCHSDRRASACILPGAEGSTVERLS